MIKVGFTDFFVKHEKNHQLRIKEMVTNIMITDEQIAQMEADMLKWAQKQLSKEYTKN